MRARAKGALLLLVAFGLGALAGALGFGVFQTRAGWWRGPQEPGQLQQRVLAHLTKELDLRPDQQELVKGILGEVGQEFSRLREEIGPRFRDIRTRSRDRIRSVLDTDQQAKFDNLAQEWERRESRRHDRPSGSAGPERKGP
ncbi:MAG: hypothetical protein NTW68_12680 [candidate division NC10 bacterium]|nr:hypothetical protein [candidate division NC10 bacterium]